MSNGTLVEQPSPEVCSQPPYILIGTVGMARTGYCGKWENHLRLSRERQSSTRQNIHSAAGSLRVAVAIVFLIVVVLFILFLVLFFFVRLCSNEDVGSHRPIRRV